MDFRPSAACKQSFARGTFPGVGRELGGRGEGMRIDYFIYDDTNNNNSNNKKITITLKERSPFSSCSFISSSSLNFLFAFVL